MKNPKLNAQRWIKEAEYNLFHAERNCHDKAYSLTCFLAEQASQKALKAVLYLGGTRFTYIHSVRELIKEVLKTHPEFSRLLEKGAILDQYYLTTRYPDAVPEPAIPSEIFTKEQAEQALDIAKKIFDACRNLIETAGG